MLIRGLFELGIRKCIATPHIIGDLYRNTPETIHAALEKTKQACAGETQLVGQDKAPQRDSASASGAGGPRLASYFDDHFQKFVNTAQEFHARALAADNPLRTSA